MSEDKEPKTAAELEQLRKDEEKRRVDESIPPIVSRSPVDREIDRPVNNPPRYGDGDDETAQDLDEDDHADDDDTGDEGTDEDNVAGDDHVDSADDPDNSSVPYSDAKKSVKPKKA